MGERVTEGRKAPWKNLTRMNYLFQASTHRIGLFAPYDVGQIITL